MNKVIFVFLSLFLVACARPPQPSSPESTTPLGTDTQTEPGGVKSEKGFFRLFSKLLERPDYTAFENNKVEYQITLNDGVTPVNHLDYSLSVKFDMPGMPGMLLDEPKVEKVGGNYDGKWVVTWPLSHGGFAEDEKYRFQFFLKLQTDEASTVDTFTTYLSVAP